MANLLSSATANGAGSGVAVSGSVRVTVPKTSVLGGAEVHIEVADTNTAGDYVTTGLVFYSHGSHIVDCVGDAYMRAVIARAGSATSVSCTAITA